MKINLLRTLLAVLSLASLSALLRAQTAAASASTPPKEDVLVLDPFRIDSGVAPDELVLPIARPFNSVFGTDDNIVDVPRNVTIISRQQLSDINIDSVLDFTKLTSSAYTTTNFGAPANPSIRGQIADLFINGVRGRITSNGNGLPLDFNSVESVNIVKGPATAVQGTSMYVGGFIDLITKRPYFDKTKGSVSVTAGSYSQKSWTVDVGGPLSKQTAYRFSYSGEDSKGYWHDYYNKNHSVYGALEFRPSESYSLFINGTWADFRYTENWGINRVTQDLIDNGNYITGINNNPAPDASGNYYDANGVLIALFPFNLGVPAGAAAPQSDAQNSRWVTSGYPVSNRMVWGPTVQISRHSKLIKPGDHSVGKEYNVQAIQTWTQSPEFKVVNNTIWSYTKRNTLSSYYYSEVIDPSWFAENRTEFIIKVAKGTINAGLDLRYQRTKAYDDYFFEPANVWDLTKDLSYINVYNSVNFPAFVTSRPIPGWPNRYATAGIMNGDTNDSHATTIGPFVQTNWDVNENFNVVLGVRYDRFDAHVREPLTVPVFIWPVDHVEDDMTVWNPNYNASLVYKPTKTSSVYLTYNYSKNTSGAVGNGGGVTGWANNPAGDFLGYLQKDSFQQPSELWEAGTKYSLKENTLFLNFAVFDQKRTAKSTSSIAIQKFHSRGFEAELNYQPSKSLYTTVSYSYIDAVVSAGFQSDGGISLLPTQGIDYSWTSANPTSRQVSGLPQHLFNTLVSWTVNDGLTLTANAMVTGEMTNNFAGTLTIPMQYSIDVSGSYRIKQWDLRLLVSNVTNEKNWAPPNSVYGNGSILALPGTQVSFTAKYSF